MSKGSLTLAALFAAAAAGGAGFLYQTSPQPGLAVVGDAHVRVAHPDRRQPLTVPFKLRNESHRPIVIQAFKSGCSCVTSDADGVTVPAGGTTTVSVTVNSFDAYAREFLQQARVLYANDRSLMLTVSGSLPDSEKVLYRPKTLTLKRDSEPDRLSASMIVRIPKQCGSAAGLQPADVTVAGVQGLHVVVEPLAESGAFREFRINLSGNQSDVSSMREGEMTVVTPCERVKVAVQIDKRVKS